MEDRTLSARLYPRVRHKEKELFYEICEFNNDKPQDVLRNFVLKYIRENKENYEKIRNKRFNK